MTTLPHEISDVTKGSIGQQEFLAKVKPDEPIFILRGRDVLAVYAIQEWIKRAEHYGVPAPKIAAALAHAELFEEYAMSNRTRLPD